MAITPDSPEDVSSTAAVMCPYAITRLHLAHFRNHARFEIDCPAGPVILTGPNGAGKTNILEAISLLTPGRGLRRATFAAMLRQLPGKEDQSEHAGGWTVSARLGEGEGASILGTAWQPHPGAGEKRIARRDGEPLRSPLELARYCSILWLTPQTEQLFLEAPGERRKFLDRLVYSFDPAHASRVSRFEHAMRERNRLLGTRNADPAWLAVLEERMAEISVAVAVARVETLERLNGSLAEEALFARPILEITGDAEAMLGSGQPSLAIEQALAERLAKARPGDAASGRSSLGAHRTRLLVWHDAHGREAEFCSTGEQKAMLLSILLAQARQSVAHHGLPPILLLDEIVSHLDEAKRRLLFETVQGLGLQVWMTGTDAADFSGLGKEAYRLALSGEWAPQ